jgi:hypothetical protein
MIRAMMRTKDRSRLLALCITACAALPAAAGAQVLSAGTHSVDGRIYTRVYVILSDPRTPYYPVPGVPIILVDPQGQSVVTNTDAAGSALLFLREGEYRLSTPTIAWHGRDYSWKTSVSVRRAGGMSDVVLNLANSSVRTPDVATLSSKRDSVASSGVSVAISAGDVTPQRAFAPDGTRLVVGADGTVWQVLQEDFSAVVAMRKGLPLPEHLQKLLFHRAEETRQIDVFPANWVQLSNTELRTYLDRAVRIRP